MIKWNRNSTLLTVLFLCAVAIISVLFALRLRDVNESYDKFVEIEVPSFSTHGYSIEDGVYTNTVGDAQIQLPEINAYINNVAVIFSAPLPQAINIAVYYATEDHEYSEEYVVSKNFAPDITEAIIPVGETITTCRVDVTTNVGERFSLEKIALNDKSMKSVDIFATILWFVVLYILSGLLFVLILFSIPVETRFALAALTVGFIYLLVITPLSPPDEPHHYQSAYHLSNYLLFQWKNPEQGDSSHFDYSNLSKHYNVKSGYQRILEGIGQKAVSGQQIDIPQPRSLAYFVQYLPQAVGISLARLLNLNFIWIFLAGRAFNLIFYSACLYFAVKRTPRFKLLLGMIGIIPMSLHQAASFSYDGFLNGMALVLIASLLKAIYEDGPIPVSDYYWMFISGLLLAPSKLVYAAIILLVLLIPRRRFHNTKKWLKLAAVLLGCSAVMVVAFQLPIIIETLGATQSSWLNWEGQNNYSISYVFAHPLSTAQIFWETLAAHGTEWFECSIGVLLSGLSLAIPAPLIYCFCGLLLLSSFEDENSSFVTSGKDRAVFLSITGLVTALIMLSMFLDWTSTTRRLIQGVQGRYFIPVLPLLFMSCNNQTIVLRKPVEKFCIGSAILLHMGVIYQVLAYTCGW